MTKDNEPTREGVEKIRRLVSIQDSLIRNRQEGTRLVRELGEAKTDVVTWLAPSDAMLNETFSIAYLDAFLTIRVLDKDKFEVTWRNGKRPRRL